MEMLTNYDYTIDYTNDADGAAETWGTEGGHGIISARKMLEWVKANCQEACPSEFTGDRHMLAWYACLGPSKSWQLMLHMAGW